MSRQGFYPVDIRVVRRVSDVGSPRVFAFVEFNTPAQASTWMKFNDVFIIIIIKFILKINLGLFNI